ncbi:MAG: condensation domain-containing protein, partial [Bacteroidota bacterium]
MTDALAAPRPVADRHIASGGEEVYVMPCSYAQQRLWFIDQWRPGFATYNMSVAVRLAGSLSSAALQASLDQLVTRHESLRTEFVLHDGKPSQRILWHASVRMQIVELGAGDAAQSEQEAFDLARQFVQHPFDLTSGPLLRALLVHIAAHESLLVLVMHHIISDGWSIGVLLRELSMHYRAQLEGKHEGLSPLQIQYADFALWQRERLQGPRLERALGYWRKRLEGLGNLDLQGDRPRPHVPTYRGAREPVFIDARLTEALKVVTRAQQATLYMTLLAAFQVLLYRHSGQENFAVGSPVAGRDDRRLEVLIGLFVNTLVMRADLAGDPGFVELVARVRENALEAYAHQDLPFERLVEELRPQRDPSRNPLVQAMFTLQNVPDSELDLPGVRSSQIELATDTAKFDLTLSLTETPDGLRGQLEYATDLFDGWRMERLVGHFRVLLEGIVADPGQRISHLPLLTEPERHQLLVEWNDTAVEYPRDRCIHELFEAQVG